MKKVLMLMLLAIASTSYSFSQTVYYIGENMATIEHKMDSLSYKLTDRYSNESDSCLLFYSSLHDMQFYYLFNKDKKCFESRIVYHRELFDKVTKKQISGINSFIHFHNDNFQVIEKKKKWKADGYIIEIIEHPENKSLFVAKATLK